jgi:hypothetical protein
VDGLLRIVESFERGFMLQTHMLESAAMPIWMVQERELTPGACDLLFVS